MFQILLKCVYNWNLISDDRSTIEKSNNDESRIIFKADEEVGKNEHIHVDFDGSRINELNSQRIDPNEEDEIRKLIRNENDKDEKLIQDLIGNDINDFENKENPGNSPNIADLLGGADEKQ